MDDRQVIAGLTALEQQCVFLWVKAKELDRSVAVPKPQRFLLVFGFKVRPLNLQNGRGSVAQHCRENNGNERLLIWRLQSQPPLFYASDYARRKLAQPFATLLVFLKPVERRWNLEEHGGPILSEPAAGPERPERASGVASFRQLVIVR